MISSTKFSCQNMFFILITVVCLISTIMHLAKIYSKPSHSPSVPSMNRTKMAMQGNIDCDQKPPPHQFVGQRGGYWVVYNYVMAQRQFRCWESVTYTTTTDFTFLNNLEPLLSRWEGPMSVALHTPGTDFNTTLWTIRYLRDCSSLPVAELVTFHIYFSLQHLPSEDIPYSSTLWDIKYNCALPPPWTNSTTYKSQNNLQFPINVGRNIAREAATTHYILASDIELYPSPGVIRDFLEMVRRQDPPLRRKNPKVFPLPLFEIEANMGIPKDKRELVAMLKNGSAIPFHKKTCPTCHNVPYSKEWLAANSTGGLHVFHIAKRTGKLAAWEPIFIGTHAEPLYDERLSWEGMKDKMAQAYALCVMDYEFQILDNAFLVHKPGIKTTQWFNPLRRIEFEKTKALIRKTIFPDLKTLYGVRKGCNVL